MDYEVFLVSQIAQYHAAGEEPRQAVRSGLAASAKVIAAAATIMIAVFGSFILNADPTVKQFGVGLSVAVLLAGTMTLLLAPALLEVFGRWTWALPRWLAKVLPHIDVEGERAPHAQPAVPITAATAVLAHAAPPSAMAAEAQSATQPDMARSSLDDLLNGQRRADSPGPEGGQ
jgi:predicted RND superfamily exporter protein